jgi:hypothetical protein
MDNIYYEDKIGGVRLMVLKIRQKILFNLSHMNSKDIIKYLNFLLMKIIKIYYFFFILFILIKSFINNLIFILFV